MIGNVEGISHGLFAFVLLSSYKKKFLYFLLQVKCKMMVDDDEVSLRVNEPYALSLVDDLYLVDYEHVSEGETVGYCILEIVRQPWKYMQWVGICMMMLGSVLLFAQGVPLSERRKTP